MIDTGTHSLCLQLLQTSSAAQLTCLHARSCHMFQHDSKTAALHCKLWSTSKQLQQSQLPAAVNGLVAAAVHFTDNQCTVTDLKAAMAAIQVKQSTKLHVSSTVLKQQQLCALAVSEAGSNGLQQHATRLRFTKATYYSRFQCTILFVIQLKQPSQLWYQQCSNRFSAKQQKKKKCRHSAFQMLLWHVACCKKSGCTCRVTQATAKWFNCDIATASSSCTNGRPNARKLSLMYTILVSICL